MLLAYRELKERDGQVEPEGSASFQDVLEKELVLAGFIGIEDPLRKEVPPAVAKCHAAGIEVLLITGDHLDTPQPVARKAGILSDEVDPALLITGEELDNLSESELAEIKPWNQGLFPEYS